MSMVDFTAEQEAEIQKRIAETKQLEQEKIAGDLFYRVSLTNLQGLVQQGVYDPFVLEVGKALYGQFRRQYLPQAQPAPAQQTAEPEKATAD